MLKILENCFKNHIAQVKESEQNGKDDLKTYQVPVVPLTTHFNKSFCSVPYNSFTNLIIGNKKGAMWIKKGHINTAGQCIL